MDAIDTAIDITGSTSSKKEAPLQYRIRPYSHEAPLSTIHDDYLNKSTKSGGKDIPKAKKDYKRISIHETLRQWWIGKVLMVNYDKGYFEAILKDLNGVESIAEFDIDRVIEDLSEAKKYIFQGAEFAFTVFTRHGPGSPETISKVEFTTPYIWKDDDNEKVKTLFRELFPEEPPLE